MVYRLLTYHILHAGSQGTDISESTHTSQHSTHSSPQAKRSQHHHHRARVPDIVDSPHQRGVHSTPHDQQGGQTHLRPDSGVPIRR